MSVSLKHQDDVCTVTISGSFTFEIHRQFRQCSEQALERSDCKYLDMDLSEVAYLDSSALGMLLLVKEKATTAGKRIRLKGASGTTLQILKTVKFDEMFDLV